MRDKNNKRLASIATAAEDAFWAEVARLVPEAKTGDLDPHSTMLFRTSCLDVVAEWMEANAPAPTVATSTAECQLVVSMRPPRKGERMYMVEARNADDALAEVLRESEELGYPAPHDHDDRPDEHGMVAVTITLRNTKHDPVESRDVRDNDSREAGSRNDWGAFVACLPEIDGWRAHWDYPGYVSWSRKDATFIVIATPDHHAKGEIEVQTQTNDGESLHSETWMQGDIPWRYNRCATTYVTALRPVLTAASEYNVRYLAGLKATTEAEQKVTLAAAAKPGALTSLTLANYQVGEIVDAILATEVLHEDAHTGAHSPIDLDDWIKNGDTILREPALKPIADYFLAMTGRTAKEAK